MAHLLSSSYFSWSKYRGFPLLSPLSVSPYSSMYGAGKNVPRKFFVVVNIAVFGKIIKLN